MDISEIEALRWKLGRFLDQFESFIYTKKGRSHFRTYVEGQLGPLPRKSIEPIADAAGISPRTLQEFLYIHRWDEDGVRDKVQAIVKRDLEGQEKIGVVDETSFPKKGRETACVQRQYCGVKGKVDNCVVSIHLSCASGDFHTLIDNGLYLPESWANDEARRRKVAIPKGVAYRPFYRIALDQIHHALENGIRFNWVVSDERYGGVPAFSEGLEDLGIAYVLELKRNTTGWTVAPHVWDNAADAGDAGSRFRNFPRVAEGAPPSETVEDLAEHGRSLREQPWVAFRIKDTDKGPEVWEVKASPFTLKRGDGASGPLTLLVMRHVPDGEMKYFMARNPEGASLETLLRVAFSRWHVERCFEDEKTEIGLDHFEVRRYISVKRHLTLSMVSHLFLAQQKTRLQAVGEKTGTHALPDPGCYECGSLHASAAPVAEAGCAG
jgi:SRSO17 transposase